MQQILFYRELGVKLGKIKKILNKPSFDELTVLKEHEQKLLEKKDFARFSFLGTKIQKTLAEDLKDGDPGSPIAQKVAELHKEGITLCWGYYDKEAHGSLVQMYVDDERFKKYYDQEHPGSAAFFRDAVHILIGQA